MRRANAPLRGGMLASLANTPLRVALLASLANAPLRGAQNVCSFGRCAALKISAKILFPCRVWAAARRSKCVLFRPLRGAQNLCQNLISL
jgi:hypothetical protein